MWKRAMLAIAIAIASPASANAKNYVIVLPPDYAGSKPALLQTLGDAVAAVTPADRLYFYRARPLGEIALIAVPDDPKAQNAAWVKRQLAGQFAPVLRHIAELPGGVRGEPPGNLMIPALLDELGRNVMSSLPERRAEVLLIGSPIYFDKRDGRWAMTDRFYPSDALLRTKRTESPFGTIGTEKLLSGMTLHFCWPNGQAEFVSVEHEERVKRWWSLWTTAQGGKVGTFTTDISVCARRFREGTSGGQTVYAPGRDEKPEMLRVAAPMPVALPASMDQPGEYFLRDDVPISRTPPTITTGIAWIGLKWNAPCDVDLYARAESSSQWLFFGHVRTNEGFFNKDHLSATGEKQFEYIEFFKPIDLTKSEVAINLYSGNLAVPPEGVIRVWFGGQVYEQPFKLAAKSGNGGRFPMTGPQWLKVDLRQVVGLNPS
jgi:hypothetical protein